MALTARLPVPVVLGSYANAYGLVRSLGEAGVRAVVADAGRGPALFSRYVRQRWRLPGPAAGDAAVEELLRRGRQLPRKGLLIPTSEAWVVAILAHRDRLERLFHLPLAASETVQLALTKTRMHRWCLAHGIRVPHTELFFPGEDWQAFLQSAEPHMPVILKPETKGVGDEDLGFFTRIFTDMDALRRWAQTLPATGPRCAVLFQQVISGPPQNIVAFHGYRAGDGRTYMAGLTKLRVQPPPCGGSTSLGRIGADEQAKQATLDLLRKLAYHGFFDAEFMWDARTGELFFIELNPRPGMPNYVATALGVNLPLIACLDKAGGTLPAERCETRQAGLWLNHMTDFLYYVLLYRRSPYGLGLADWWRSLRGEPRLDALLNRRDLTGSAAAVLHQAWVCTSVLGRTCRRVWPGRRR